MKRIRTTGIIVAVLLVLGLVIGSLGCKGPAPTPTPAVPPSKPTPPATAPTPAQAKTWNLKMQSIYPPADSRFKLAASSFVPRIEKASGGRIKIDLQPAGVLVPVLDAFGPLGKGVLDLMEYTAGYVEGTMPVAKFMSYVLFGNKTYHEMYTLRYQLGLSELLREAYAERGVYYVGKVINGSYGNMISTKPVRGVQDLKGLKIRTGFAPGRVYESFGASTVVVPLGEVYTAMSTRVVDAATVGPPRAFYDLKLHEVAKYYILPPLTPTSGTEIDMNLKLWNELPDDLKEIFHLAQEAYSDAFFALQEYMDAEAVKLMKAAKVEFITLPDEDVAKMKKVARDQWEEMGKADARSAKALAIIKDYIVNYLGY